MEAMMAPTRNPRNYKRVPQACGNCRRKKNRCPGEKPACSHCVRLRQVCQYPDVQSDVVHASHSSNNHLEDRLAQLEEKLDMVLERPRGLLRQNETPESISNNNPSPTLSIQASSSGLLPSYETIVQAIDTYYAYAHRQPLWLFDHDNSLTPSSCEELLLTIMSIAAQHSSNHSNQENMLSAEVYSDAARNLIMLKIAAASVDLSILQALCLLAYSNILLNDISLASFHLMLAKTLLQSSGLESQISPERSPKSEEQRRLVWSVFLLDYICGQQQSAPCLYKDIYNPRHLKMGGMLQTTSSRCSSLPCESYDDEEEKSLGIWGHMVGMVSVWAEIRRYISRCAEGDSEAPWRPDSTYTFINSHVLDLERVFPDFYRYDSANFSQRSIAEISAKRESWLPWLRVQIDHHATHCLLNHPFLLSSTKPKTITGTNAFWKTASQLALIHSTWISRLLEMAKEKGLQLSDPSFTYSAVIAATLHTYWSRAADATVRSSARKYLETCRSFVTEWGPQWPICQAMAALLNDFLQIMLGAQPTTQRDVQRSDTAKADLMWKILESAVSRPDPRGKGLFQPSFFQEQELYTSTRRGGFSFDDPEIDTTPENLHDTVGEYAAPYDRFFPLGTSQLGEQSIVLESEEFPKDQPPSDQASLRNINTNSFPSLMNWSWTPVDAQSFPDLDIRFHEQGGANLDWWDTGIL